MRVIAGKYRSRALRSLPGMDLRPTADRLRETLFDVLCAGNPSAIEGSTWLDLFAGTGAVGIEAISRGAGKVYFVEASQRATELIAANLASLQIGSEAHVVKEEVSRALRRFEAQQVVSDFIFLDPPYQMHACYADTLARLAESPLLAPAGLVIAEHVKKFDPGEGAGELRRFRKLQQGDAALSFYRRKPAG